MKISAAAVTTAILASVATAAPAAAATTVQVQTYNDIHCSKPNELVTLTYKSDACQGRCDLPNKSFKSYKVVKQPTEQTFLLVTTFGGDATDPCFSNTAFNSTHLNDATECITSYQQEQDSEGNPYKFAASSLKLEIASP